MEEIYLSGKELSREIAAPIRTIENWAAAGKITQDAQGKYGLKSAYRFQLAEKDRKIENLREEKEKLIAKSQEGTREARERKIIAEADKEEALARIKNLEALRLEGKLVVAEEALAAWQNAVVNTRAKLINLPSKLALEIFGLKSPQEIQSRLTTIIDEILNELGEE